MAVPSGVHVSYVYDDGSGGELRYAYLPSPTASWSVTTVGPGTGGTSLALDATNGVHIAYLDPSAYQLRYARRAADGSWTSTLVSSYGGAGEPAIAVDADGRVDFAFTLLDGDGSHEVDFAYPSSGASWSLVAVASGAPPYHGPSLAMDDRGGVHIAYAVDDGGPSGDPSGLVYTDRPPCVP